MWHSSLYSQPTHMFVCHIRSSEFTIEESLNIQHATSEYSSYIVRIEYKINYNGVKISGAGMMEFYSTCLESRLL